MAKGRESLDDFLKKALESYQQQDIPFNESYWQEMENMLDAEMPITSSPSNTYHYASNLISAVSALVLVLGIVLNYNVQKQNALINQEPQVQEDPVEQTTLPDNQLTNPPTAPAANESDPVIVRKAEPDTKTEERLIAPLSPSDVSKVQEGDPSETSSVEVTDEARDANPLVNQEADVEEVRSEDRRSPSGESGNSELEPRMKSTQVRALPGGVGRRGVDGDFHSDAQLPASLSSIPERTTPEQVDQIIAAKAASVYPRFAISVVYSPDLSSNALFQYNRFGSEFGLLLEYRLARRLSIEGGALLTRKRYKTDAENYESPAGFWAAQTDGVIPSEVDASCRVLDVPINLRYRILENDIHAISTSLGVSSYFMLTEDYDFTMPWGTWYWGTKGSNQHFLGVGNIQVHYERKLGRQFAMEIAPFLKVPLTGYGHGNIRFHTLGALVGIKRYFGFKPARN